MRSSNAESRGGDGNATVEAALIALESQGVVLRGQFRRPPPAAIEFCERGLLSRIHRYTLNRLRAEIEEAERAGQVAQRTLADVYERVGFLGPGG